MRAAAYPSAYSRGHRTLDDLLTEPTVKNKVKNHIKLLQVQDRRGPRAEITDFRARLRDALAGSGPKFEFEIVGEYRRGSQYPHSTIKVLVWHRGYERRGQDTGIQALYERLAADGLFRLEDMLRGGPNSPPEHGVLGGLVSIGEDAPLRFLEIRIVPTESVPYRLFWDTGASWLVTHMRREAKKRGLELWAGGMQPLGEERPPKTAILIDNERELFELLDVPWIKPDHRNTKSAHTMLPKLRAWSSASRPSSDYLNRVLGQATVVKPGRVHPINVPEIVMAARLPLPQERARAAPAFPRIDIEGAGEDINIGRGRAAASLSPSRFRRDELARVERRQREEESVEGAGEREGAEGVAERPANRA